MIASLFIISALIILGLQVHDAASCYNINGRSVLSSANGAYTTMFVHLSIFFFLGIFIFVCVAAAGKLEKLKLGEIIAICSAYIAIFISVGGFIETSIQGRINAAKIEAEIWAIKNSTQTIKDNITADNESKVSPSDSVSDDN